LVLLQNTRNNNNNIPNKITQDKHQDIQSYIQTDDRPVYKPSLYIFWKITNITDRQYTHILIG